MGFVHCHLVVRAGRTGYDAAMSGERLLTRRAPWLLLVLAAACSRPAGESAPGSLPARRVGEGDRVWQGVFPCSDCRGIETRLLLRASGDRREYVLSESYLGARTRLDENQSGHWREAVPPTAVGGAAAVVLLSPGEPRERRFALLEDGSLELLDADGSRLPDALAYRLPRR